MSSLIKFFIPEAESEEQALSIYQGLVEAYQPKGTKSVYSITYDYRGKTVTATVGSPLVNTSDFDGQEVIAILSGNPYMICTDVRGVLGGTPIYVKHSDISSETLFQ